MNALFVERLLRAVPELMPIYQTHIRNNDELLPYPFMGDATRLVVAECGRLIDGQTQADLFIGSFLAVLETELMAQDEEISGLIALGFCENLCGEPAAISILKPRMGPLLAAKMKPFL